MIPVSDSALIMESKDETSDTDSGIILQSGPDSPMTPLKDLTHAMKLRQKSLEEKLEACLQELKKICIREAELTGKLPKEYPLAPGEKAPRTRRRIGTAFKLDERTIANKGEDTELGSLERDFSLQCQITEAARRLSHEPHLSNQIKKQRRKALVKQEKKLRELEQTLNDLRIRAGHKPLTRVSRILAEELSASDDSSLSDAAVLDDEEPHIQKPHAPAEIPVPGEPACSRYSPLIPKHSARPLPPQTLEGLKPLGYTSPQYDRSPIQNTEWKESSLDQPYEKPKKCSSTPSSQSSSPAVTPQLTPITTPVDLRMGELASYQFVPIKNVGLHNHSSSSAPSTPELQGRRLQSQSVRVAKVDFSPESQEQRGRNMLPRRCPTNFTAPSLEYFNPQSRANVSNPMYRSSSEDSNSDLSIPSYDTSSQDGSLDMTMPWPVYQPPPPAGHSPHFYRNMPFNNQEAQGFYKNVQHMSSPSFYKMYGFEEGRATSPLARELELHHQLEGRTSSSLARELEFHHPLEGRTASPLTRELEFHHPLEGRTASPLIRELEFHHPLEGRTASPLTRELEFHHPLEGRTTSPLARDLEFRHPLLKSTQSAQFPHREYHYGDERTQLMVQRVTPSHSRIVRTPSLKEYPHRGLPRDVVTEQLQSWHERSRRSRSGRPHSLDRQGAIRVRSVQGHEQQSLRVPAQHFQLPAQHFQSPQRHSPQRHVLKRNPDGVPSQWYLPEEAEIVSQV